MNIAELTDRFRRSHGYDRLETRAALFDMDGTLYDSMPGHAGAWMKMCAEAGLDAVPEEEKDTPFVEGIAMVYKQMLTALEEIGVKPIEAVGQEFDPNFHNAVMTVEDDELDSGMVAEELQKGYLYQDSVVRHSMVKVVS